MKTKTKIKRKWEKVKSYYKVNRGALWFSFIAGIIAAIILINSLFNAPKTSPQPLGQTIIQEVKADEHDEEYYKAEPLRYLRYRGEQLGINEYTITKIITMITTCENKKLDPEAYNINNDKYRSMDVGIMMINMYWHRHEVKLVDMLDPVKNIDYGYKLFLEQGFEPWACAHKLGYVK